MIQTTEPFRDVGFDAIELEPIITDDLGQSRRESLRLLIVTDLRILIEEAVSLAHEYAEHGPAESQPFFDFCLQMLPYVGICDKIDPINDRRFNSSSFDRSSDFREMILMTRTRHVSQAERLKRFVTSDHHFDANSFEAARYGSPRIVLPLDQTRYAKFRKTLLEEMVGIRAELARSADESVRSEARNWLEDRDASKEKKQKAREILRAADVFDVCPELYDTWDEVEQMLMKEALQIETERTKPFESLIQPASRILADATDRSAADNAPAKGAIEMSDDQIRRFLDIDSAAEMVHQIVKLGSQHPDTMGRQAQKLMAEAVQSREACDLWEALEWFCENMVNRNECIRLLVREAEWILNLLLELALEQRYMVIRSQLSVAERRLFHFLYRRSKWFNDRIPAFDELGKGFLCGLGEEHASLVFGVAGYRGDRDQTEELEARWKAYVGLYPFWVELLRSAERERKKQRRDNSLTDVVEDDLGCDDPRTAFGMHLPRELVDASVDSVQMLAERYCTGNQQAVILARFVDQKPQSTIAIELGVSQQAVSRSLRCGLDRIHRGLVADQRIEPTNDRRWSF